MENKLDTFLIKLMKIKRFDIYPYILNFIIFMPKFALLKLFKFMKN